jgi:hypothetical protein
MESSSSPENNSDSDTKDNDKIEYNYINYNISANVDDGIDPYQELITPTPNISTQFPSNAYRDFMNIIIKYNLSNAAGDLILKFIQNYGHCTDVHPKSTRIGCNFIDNLDVKNLSFKEVVFEYANEKYIMHYRCIFEGIQELLKKPEIIEYFHVDFELIKVIILTYLLLI